MLELHHLQHEFTESIHQREFDVLIPNKLILHIGILRSLWHAVLCHSLSQFVGHPVYFVLHAHTLIVWDALNDFDESFLYIAPEQWAMCHIPLN